MNRNWRELWKRECAGTLRDYRILVPDSVPDSVLSAWGARGYALSAGASAKDSTRAALMTNLMNRNLIRSNVSFTSWTSMGVAGTAVLSLSTAVGFLATGGIAEVGVIASGIAAAATAGVSGYTGLKFRRDPKRLSRRDRVAATRARWITASDLGWTLGKNGQDTDEQRLFHLAVVTARKIVATSSWNHAVLADHVSRVDLDHAVASIGVRLKELYEVRTELDSHRDPHTAAQIDVYQARLAEAFRSMAHRVVAMHEYLDQLKDLSAQLRLLENSEASKALGQRVIDVLSRTADDESADWRFRELNIEAESHGDAIRSLLGELETSAGQFDDFDSKLLAAERESRADPR